MNHDGQLQLACEPHLRTKDRLLHVARRVIIVIIEADFAYRSRRGRPGELVADGGDDAFGVGAVLVRRMRMDADRRAHIRPELVDPPRLRRFLFVAGLENDEGPLEPCLARAANDAFELRAEGLVGQMAVRVDHRSPDGSRGDRSRSAKTSQRLAGCETTPPCASTYSFTRSFPRL